MKRRCVKRTMTMSDVVSDAVCNRTSIAKARERSIGWHTVISAGKRLEDSGLKRLSVRCWV